jgi:hypothetical protein
MDTQNLINIAFTCIGTLIGWVVKNIWDAVSELRSDIKEIERDLHEDYVRKDDFRAAIDRIEAICNRIVDKLDAKADKS